MFLCSGAQVDEVKVNKARVFLCLMENVNYHKVYTYFVSGSFTLFFQPQYDSDSNKVRGFEGLIRIYENNKVVMYPQELFSIVNGTGLEDEIGFWVVKKAFEFLIETKKVKFSLSVNVDGNTLSSDRFLEYLKKLKKSYPNVATNRLEFEIVESEKIFDLESACHKIKRVSDMGFGIALDDFGVGYSSLFYLKLLPINNLKIDRAFVFDIVNNSTSVSIAKTIINLSRLIGTDCVAEGVETAEQLSTLKKLGCNVFQGFLISRPIPFDELGNWYQQWNERCKKINIRDSHHD